MSIYLDNSASTPLAPAAAEAIAQQARHLTGNPSSLHRYGQGLKALLEDTRHLLASQLGCSSGEITFTSGGTESNNLALQGVARVCRAKGKHILVSPIEHPSVIETARRLEQDGFEVEWLPMDAGGQINPHTVEERLRPDTILVSAMWINNETGIIQPIEAISEICRANKTLYHCDAVQAFGKVKINLTDTGVDLLSVSAHKAYGPAGCGALFIRRGTPLDAYINGGGQEANRRAGTENILGISGFKAALEELEQSLEFYSDMQKLQQSFEHDLCKQAVPCQIIGSAAPRSPYITLAAFPGLEQDTLLMALDMAGIAASAGSACSSGSLRPSHVLQAMRLESAALHSSIRFSFGRFTSAQELDQAVQTIAAVCARLRK